MRPIRIGPSGADTIFGNRSKNIFRVEARTDVPMGVVPQLGNFFDRTNRRSRQGTDCVERESKVDERSQ